jgi:hypothetical protein
MLDVARISINGIEHVVELAKTDQSKWQGLSDRPSLAPGAGMLFIWDDEAPRRFSMRRMHFNIDILFLDKSGVLVNMCTDVAPWDGDTGPYYFSEGPSMYVLEIAAGASRELGLEVGSLVLDVEALARGG